MGKQFAPDVKQVFIKPNEAKFVAIMTALFFSDLKKTEKEKWNNEGKRLRKEIRDAAISLRSKLEKLGYDVSDLDPYEEGDEDEFLEK